MASSGLSTVAIAALAALVLQNAFNFIVMRVARITAPQVVPGTVVLASEIFKLVGAGVLACVLEGKTIASLIASIRHNIFGDVRQMLKLAVPAALYVVQNNALLVASGALDAGTVQVLSQMKVLTTALAAAVVLGTRYSKPQLAALALLFVGGVTVQSHALAAKPVKSVANDQQASLSPMLGLLAVLVAVACSGSAGVWFERMLKREGGGAGVWERNVHMALLSIPITGMAAFTSAEHRATVMQAGLFGGWNYWVVASVLLSAGGGLLVALVVKHTSNIAKSFATGISTVLTSVISVVFLGTQLGWEFPLGALLILLGSGLYGTAPKPAAKPLLSPERKG